MGETPTAGTPPPQYATPPSQATPVLPSRTPWLLFGLLVLFALLFLLSISPVLAGCGVALAVVGGIIAALPEGEKVRPKPKKKEHHWTISGVSPVRQEITFCGETQSSIGFWFMGNQSLAYQFDIFDDAGNEVRHLPRYPAGEPNDLCWVADDGGPGGTIWITNKHPWKVTIRYVLRALDERVVRSADLHVEVKPAAPEIKVPEKPTPLNPPLVQWGRMDTPPDQLKSLPPGVEWTGPQERA
jgi:hypothetical protein